MRRQQRYRYVGTPDPMTQKEAYQCEKYMKKNRDSLVRAGEYLVDVPALLSLFHLDCWNCRAVHGETCCEGGQPYAVQKQQMSILEEELALVAAQLGEEKERTHWMEYGIWDIAQPPGTIRMRHGNCLFYQELDGRRGCAIHAHAERTGKELFPLKPFSCQLYPLDLIDTGDAILLTAVTPDTSSFSRWGTDYLEHFYCASKERRQQADHVNAELFSLDGYRPAYEWNMPLLRYLLKEHAEQIEALMAERSVNVPC